MLVERELIFGWDIVVKLEKESFNISFNIKAEFAVIVLGGIIPFQVKA